MLGHGLGRMGTGWPERKGEKVQRQRSCLHANVDVMGRRVSRQSWHPEPWAAPFRVAGLLRAKPSRSTRDVSRGQECKG